MKKKIKITSIIFIVFVLSAASWFISYSKLNVHNPFSAAYGLLTVFYTENSHAVIGNNPKVIIAKPDYSLESYMQNLGFIKEEESQLGSLHVYTYGDDREYIMVSVNGYYAKWCWLE